MSDKIVLIHTAIEGMTISESAVQDALDASGPKTDTLIVRVRPCELPLRGFDTASWDALAAEQERQYHESLAPVLRDRPDSPIVYFGLAPIPLAIHLGSLVGQKPRVLARLHHHDLRTWRWPQMNPTPDLMNPHSPLTPDPGFDGEVVLRVHTSYRITPGSTQRSLTGSLREIDVCAKNHHPDALRSSDDLDVSAQVYKQALDDSCNAYPMARVRNVFASVPAGLAFRMGTAINPTIHTPLQTWKYMSSRDSFYRRAILIGESPQPPRVLVLGASPADTPAISSSSEVHEVATILTQSPLGDPIEVVSDSSVTLEGLSALLHRVPPNFLHIASHGRAPHRSGQHRDISPPEDDGALILGALGTPGRSRAAEIRDLAQYLDRLPRLRVVVATVCHSDELARALQRHNRVVIGFKGKLGDEAARAFSRAFWSSMMRPRCSVAEAFHTGCVEMGRPGRNLAVLLPEGAGENIFLTR